ncbi:uncharacterized protein [Mytilus edulis]|uniref:uncharacterized protein n=1 Tax=Mytilus edulis TaxID=6550 RepID=UPI0039F141D0
MLNAGFNLRSWTSNNENARNLAIKEDVLDTDKEAKILGMRLNVETDELSYAKRVLSSVSSNITKREILKESSKIFDPLRFLSPVSIRAKILMQDLWKERYDWDETLPENLQLQWKDLAKDIGIVTNDNEETLDEESNTDKIDDLHFGIDKIINAYRYGSYKKLLRVTTYVQRFIQNCKTTKSIRNTGEIQPDELQQSTILWIRCCQATAYPGEVRALTLKNAQKTKLPRLRQLQLYLDENNLMRCKGRIHNAPLSESAKHPYILLANHRLSELIVLNSHELVIVHSGVNANVTKIRQTFWIPSLRQFTRKLLHRCTTCKKVNGKPYRAPDPPPLQKIRLQEASPFTVTGIDFTAALQVKENDASQEVKRLCESKKIEEALSSFGVEWRFIPKRAPWFGGWWERLIALTKTNLKKTLGRALINFDMLQTFVTEIEKILNDRPLTYVSTDIIDSEPLTPAHLLFGRRVTTLPYPRTEMDNINETYALTASDISKRAQRLSTHIEHFLEPLEI